MLFSLILNQTKIVKIAGKSCYYNVNFYPIMGILKGVSVVFFGCREGKRGYEAAFSFRWAVADGRSGTSRDR